MPWELKVYFAYLYYTPKPGEYDNYKKLEVIDPKNIPDNLFES